jgi:hypothetical protein|tara:strand:+ start:457 stop:585 length:129 start_codon:yes stop_codon:yes gene_type:complete
MAKKKKAKKAFKKELWGSNKVSENMGFANKGKYKKAFAKAKF